MSRVLSDRVNGWLFFCLSVFQVGATRVAVPDQRILFELEGPPPPPPHLVGSRHQSLSSLKTCPNGLEHVLIAGELLCRSALGKKLDSTSEICFIGV
jgi:hypothetical protein